MTTKKSTKKSPKKTNKKPIKVTRVKEDTTSVQTPVVIPVVDAGVVIMTPTDNK